jgi:hypothetical protein
MKASARNWAEGVRCDPHPGAGRGRSGEAKPASERLDYLLGEDLVNKALREIKKVENHRPILVMSWDQLATLRTARLAMQAVCRLAPSTAPESAETSAVIERALQL